MTRNYIDADGTRSVAGVIDQETRQFKRLIAAGVTDEKELAQRMATSVRAIRVMKKFF